MKTTLRLFTLAFTLAAALPSVAAPPPPPAAAQFAFDFNPEPEGTMALFADINGDGVSDVEIDYPGTGVVLRNVRLVRPTSAMRPPGLGETQTQSFGMTVEMDVAMDAGSPAQHRTVQAQVTTRLVGIDFRPQNGQRTFDTEMLALNISGGDLPVGMMIRENPARPSTGGLVIVGATISGHFEISSFFDIFTELSLDGGQNWTPSPVACRFSLIAPSGLNLFATSNLPPAAPFKISDYESPRPSFGNGVVLSNLVLRINESAPPPPPGPAQVVNSGATLQFDLSTDGGVSYNSNTYTGTLAMRFVNLELPDSGGTRYYETEMLSMDFSGPGLRLRESPTKQSLGRASGRFLANSADVDGDGIACFFDVFTEVSLDGGATWMPCRSGQITFGLPSAPMHEVIFVKGDPMPTGTGVPTDAIITKVGLASINQAGDMAVLLNWSSRTMGSGAGIALRLSQREIESIPSIVAYTGGITGAGNVGLGTTIAAFTADPVIGEDGSVRFYGQTIDHLSSGVAAKHTVVAAYNGSDGPLQIVAESGMAAPGVPGAVFSKFSSATACGNGGTLVVAYLKQEIGGVNSKNDYGLWHFDKTGYGQLVLRENSTAIGMKTVKSIAGLSARSKTPGARFSNDMLEVVSRVIFTTGEQATILTILGH